MRGQKETGNKQGKYFFYGGTEFQATWKKFGEILKRDGTNPSRELRIWIEGYVARKDPGNPQRPLTAWAPGHPDEEARQGQDFFAWLIEYAENRRNEVPYRQIVDLLKEMGVPASKRPTMAGDLAKRLTKAGLKVSR